MPCPLGTLQCALHGAQIYMERGIVASRTSNELDEVRLVLTRLQKVWAVLVALALIAGGIGSCAQGVVTYHDWACRMGYWSVLGCAGEVDIEPEQSEHTYSPPVRRP